MSGVELKVDEVKVLEFEGERIIVHEGEISRRLREFKDSLKKGEDVKKFRGIVCPNFEDCEYRIKLESNEVIQGCIERIFCNWYYQACDVNYLGVKI